MTASFQETVISQPLSSCHRFLLQTSLSSRLYYSFCVPSQAQARHFGPVIPDLKRTSTRLGRRTHSNLQTSRHYLLHSGYKQGGMNAAEKRPAGKLMLASRELHARSTTALLLQQSWFSLNLSRYTTCM